MKKVFNALKVNENDSKLKAYTKVGVKGLIGLALTVGAGMGALALVGKHINRNDELEVFNMEMEAE